MIKWNRLIFLYEYYDYKIIKINKNVILDRIIKNNSKNEDIAYLVIVIMVNGKNIINN
jgi:hypothetical protein